MLGKRNSRDSGKLEWSRFDQAVVGVRCWGVRCGFADHPTGTQTNGSLDERIALLAILEREGHLSEKATIPTIGLPSLVDECIGDYSLADNWLNLRIAIGGPEVRRSGDKSLKPK